MSGKREANREQLRDKLLNAATKRVEAGGMKDINARTLTKDAGCALGSLYTAFTDIDDLIIHMNSRTLKRLGEAIEAAGQGVDDPVDRLKALAKGYLQFAADNHALWVALFDYAALAGTVIPQWHQQEQEVLVRHIVGPVSSLNPDMDNDAMMIRVRTLFSAVHGIVSLSLDQRFIGLPQDELESELMRFIDQMVAGQA